MHEDFASDGLSFRYPVGWTLEREDSDEGWTVLLQSPGTAFALFRLDRSLPTPEEVVTTALNALKEDYPKLEAEPAIENLAGEMAIGHDIEFFSLDLVVHSWTRSFFGPAGTLLVLCQVSDVDADECEPLLRALRASLRADE